MNSNSSRCSTDPKSSIERTSDTPEPPKNYDARTPHVVINFPGEIPLKSSSSNYPKTSTPKVPISFTQVHQLSLQPNELQTRVV